MKKIFSIFLALSSAVWADTVLTMDFTKLTGNSGSAQESNMPEGWSQSGHRTVSGHRFNFGENGATVAEGWKQDVLDTAVSLNPASDSYTITFSSYASTSNCEFLFYLSSDDYTLAVGNSYNSNSAIYVGSLDRAADTFISFQTNTGANPTVFEGGTSSGISVGQALDYTLTLSSGVLEVSVTDGSAQWSSSFDIQEGVTFTKLGFMLDGNSGTVGVKSVTVASVPEPATAVLGLCALAGLTIRRKRK